MVPFFSVIVTITGLELPESEPESLEHAASGSTSRPRATAKPDRRRPDRWRTLVEMVM